MLAVTDNNRAATYQAVTQLCGPVSGVALGVSGGSDSLALLNFMAGWSRSQRTPVTVFTVDHRLRPESADEARMVADRAEVLGLAHQTLVWADPVKQQSAARLARMRLLAKATRQAGASVLMTAHTLNDVAENVLMRRRRRAPLEKLAGPSPVSMCPIWPEGRGITLVRPFLGAERETLRQGLSLAGQDWIDDPSNADRGFERVRVRQFLARHAGVRQRVLEISRSLLAKRCAYEGKLGDFLATPGMVEIDGFGLIRLDQSLTPPELERDVLSLLIRLAAGSDDMPSREGLARLAAFEGRMTLGGAWLQKRGGTLIIGRDPGGASGVGTSGLWDGRYEPSSMGLDVESWPYLLRQSAPPGPNWQQLASERLTSAIAAMRRAATSLPEIVPEDIVI